MNDCQEVQIDGLIGPTHHYAGLSHGNVACMSNAHSIANPKEAALQGLKKMKFISDLGIPQMVVPPHPRPHWRFLRSLGFHGSKAQMLESAYKKAPNLLAAAYSASSMWTANAATIAPSSDTADGKIHITPANLQSKLHRAIEAPHTAHLLSQLFPDPEIFLHHEPLPHTPLMSDEGAANHMRICASHDAPGLQVFVYGKSVAAGNPTKIYEARQHEEASKAIIRAHCLSQDFVCTIQQHPMAIDAGSFHNDVISMNNESLLIFHSYSFENSDAILSFIKRQLFIKDIHCIHIDKRDCTLEDAIKTYLFNSQLVTLPEGGMLLLTPMECKEHAGIWTMVEGWRDDSANPIVRTEAIDVRESMKNGGGPACLRLRMVANEKERASMHQPAFLTDGLYTRLVDWVSTHYRDRLVVDDLQDLAFAQEVQQAMQSLESILEMDFQFISFDMA